MVEQEQVMSQFFQALSDQERLQVIGQLAVGPKTIEQLGLALGLETSALKRHLRVISRLGLLEELPDGRLAFDPKGLQELRQCVFKRAAAGSRRRTEREKVLATFFENDRVTSLPVQHKRKLIVIRELLRDVEPGRVYPEQELNQLIAKRYEDFCTVRRYWVDLGYMQRSGGNYQLRPESEWPESEGAL